MAIVTAAQYQEDFISGDNVSIKATINGVVCYVPLATDNTDRILIQAWEDAGNTIAAAD